MGIRLQRKITKIFFITIGLTMFILIVTNSEYFLTSISRMSYDRQVNIKKNMPNINFNDKRMQQFNSEPQMKDWHDYEAIEAALSRKGLGELGEDAFVENHKFGEVKAAINKSYYNYGVNGYLSDRISVNRSVPDFRAEVCKSNKYLAKLTKVSIIIPFRDESFSVLMRTAHGITNRTPPELLEEIILVDDNSILENLKEKLDKYIAEFLPKVKIVRLTENNGLMRARLAGAKQAKSEIIVIMDAHIEVGYNWLPPLIEPIVLNYKFCTLPYIDIMNPRTLSLIKSTPFRGGFDWQFHLLHLPLLSENDETIPHSNPAMMGSVFAINAKFFWELGGYDNELQIWGGEQYELGFKIWMCGGKMLNAPCSRVAHMSRISQPLRYKTIDFFLIFRNYLRIAEVWMDDYKKYVYDNVPEKFRNMNIGDVSERKALREQLQCNSFEWYLKEIAFDSLEAMNLKV